MNILRIHLAPLARHRAQRHPITRAALVLSMVDTSTGTQHRIPVETAALHRRSGRYPALCGIDVAAAGLTTPATDDCRDCATLARQTAATPDRTPRRSLLRRWRSPRPAHRRAAR